VRPVTDQPALPGHDGGVIRLPTHIAIELLAGLALIAGAFVLALSPAGLVIGLAGGVLLAGLALAEDLPLSSHQAADAALALAMMGAAVALAAAGDAPAAVLLAAAGAVQLALGAVTRWTRA
jgi:hypothetical protein